MNITKGRIRKAERVVIYGVEGIGKSTFASSFPDPVFIDTEGSTEHMDISRFDSPSSWNMLLQEVQYVLDYPDCCKTLVIDTADWAENLEIKDLCAEKHWDGLEDAGYGKGYQYSAERFGKLLNMLRQVSDKGIHVVLTAHAWLRKVELPEEMGAYDHWEMKTSKKVAPLIREWATMVLFANYKTLVVNVDGQGSQKGKNKAQGGKRVMYAAHTPFWDAKNRHGLPDEMDFSYEAIRHIIEAVPVPAQVNQSVEKEPEPVIRPHSVNKATAPMETVADKQRTSESAPEGNGRQMTMNLEPNVNLPPMNPPETLPNTGTPPDVDPRIQKNLRDLMIANNVCEWDIQMVVEARGYFPGDMPVYDYPKDFVDGCLVAAWDKVFRMIKTMKEKEQIPFN